jgi:ABC-type uncharacterized transport system ATPase subunit
VLSIADEITVIRQGTTVGSVNPHTQKVSARDLAEMMVGNELPTPDAVGDTIQDEVVLKVENLSVLAKGGKAVVDNISFQIRAGEIVGIAGVEGNGQAEILDALMGIESATGKVYFKDEDITRKCHSPSPRTWNWFHPRRSPSTSVNARSATLGKSDAGTSNARAKLKRDLADATRR